MKKIISLLYFLVLLSGQCFAGLAVTNVWEVRVTGNDSNAGCFDSALTGTDFSQQDSPQFSFADLVVGATTTHVTSASHSFVATDVGNCIHISAGTGFTTGWFEILSVTGGAAVLDRSAGTASSTGGTWVEGGALLTSGQACNISVGGNVIYLLYSATPFGITTSTAGPGGQIGSCQVIFQSYATTRSVFNSDSNHATIQVQAASITAVTGSAALISGIIFDGNSQTTAKFNSGASTFYKDTIKNFNTAGTSTPILVQCYVTANSAAVATGTIIDSEIASNTATPITNTTVIVGSLIHHNSGASTDGINVSLSGVVIRSSLYNNGRSGINMSSGTLTFLGIDVDSESNAAYGYTFTSGASPKALDYYAGFGNTTALTNNSTGTLSLGTTFSLTGSAFTAPGSGNFALNTTSGAGALLRNAGTPSVFPAGNTNTYLDVGAARHQDPAGSSVTVGYPISQ